MDILGIYCWNIHGISMDIPCISASMDIHGISMDIPCIYHVYVSGLHIHGIYYVYTRYILKIGVPDDPPRGPGCLGSSGILYTWTGSGKIVHTGMYQYVPVCTGIYRYMHLKTVRTGTYQYILGKIHVDIEYTLAVLRELNSTVYMSSARDMIV